MYILMCSKHVSAKIGQSDKRATIKISCHKYIWLQILGHVYSASSQHLAMSSAS